MFYNDLGNSNYQQLAVEFDTYKNDWDPDDNHIAIDTQSAMHSLLTKTLNPSNISLTSGKQIRVKIQYDHKWKKQLQIYMGYEGSKQLISVLNYSIDISKTIPTTVYIVFTALTGILTESHYVLDWMFTTYLDMNKKENKIIWACLVPVLIGLIMLAIVLDPMIRRRMNKKREMIRSMEDIERQYVVTAPRKFSYKQLVKSTKNFSKDNLLGSGGFWFCF